MNKTVIFAYFTSTIKQNATPVVPTKLKPQYLLFAYLHTNTTFTTYRINFYHEIHRRTNTIFYLNVDM